MSSKRNAWASRSTFILAAIGSAVGLGNAWRFPGLAYKHGGGAFMLVYLVGLVLLGIPLLMVENAVGRRMQKGAPESFRGLKKCWEPVGWSATFNAFLISTYYSVVFAWVLLMVVMSYKFAGMTGNDTAAGNLFAEVTGTTWQISGRSIPWSMLLALLVAWILIFWCIRNGASSVGKVVKYTVFLPVMFLVILAIKGCTMPGAMEGLTVFFRPDFSALADAKLWVDAIGQVFYSLSICMAIMFAYGSYLDRSSNLAEDVIIIAVSDLIVSVLSGIVMFSTMGGVGMLDSITDSGIGTAFIVYPQAIVHLTDIGWLNALFGAVFYLMLVTLAIDSAFSIIEAVSTALSDKFHLNHRKTTLAVCGVSGMISLLYATSAGVAWLDIVDNWCNNYNMVLLGIVECLLIGWGFSLDKVLEEINRNTRKWKMPRFWLRLSIRWVAPILLSILFIWNMVQLFAKNGGIYGDYPLWAEILGGWLMTAMFLAIGFIMRAVVKHKKKAGFQEDDISWEDMEHQGQ